MHVINLRLVATLPSEHPSLQAFNSKASRYISSRGEHGSRKAYWGKEHGFLDTPVFELEQIKVKPSQGPVLVDCYDTTIVVPPGCAISTGEWGNVIIEVDGKAR